MYKKATQTLFEIIKLNIRDFDHKHRMPIIDTT